jgi:3-hydroxybutyryl-CoA dehydrogenase
MEITTVGVVGCGLMGSGIAQVAATAGYDVRVLEVDEAAVARGHDRIAASLETAVAREKLSPASRDEAMTRLSFTTAISELARRDLVIEAIVEELDAKVDLFTALDAVVGEGCIYATNTSSLSVTRMAAATARPDRLVGLHFFNPVPVMKLVEVVRTLATSDDTFATVRTFARSLGKEVVLARDASGFVVNRLLVPYMLDAIRQLGHGVATVDDIDRAMELGCGHPMGPLKLCDFVGNDTTLRIAEIMFDEYREPRYAPPPLLKRMVALGRLGRKAGVGFYDYRGDAPTPLAP